MKKKKDASNPKDNAVKMFFEAIGEENGFGRFNMFYNWLYHCGLKESEVRVVHYVLNYTLNGRPCMSRKEVIAFNLGISPKTVERAISNLRNNNVLTGTKKSNPQKNGKYTGSHIKGGYVVNGKRLLTLFQENYKPDDKPQRGEDQKEATDQLLAEMYGKVHGRVSPFQDTNEQKELDKEERNLSKQVPEVTQPEQEVRDSGMTPEEEDVFGSFKKVIVTHTETGEIFEFQSPLRAFMSMQKSIQNDDYSSKSVARQLMGGKVDVHESFVFTFID